jgi:surfactin synthase thioesterase subunit
LKLFVNIFYFSIGTIISFALARHMIETTNQGDLIKLLIAMGRGPPHLES